MQSSIKEQALNTIFNFRKRISEEDITTFKDVYNQMKVKYYPQLTDAEILNIAHMSENTIRRMSSEAAYYGPKEEGCLKLALAMGIDNEYDIDGLLNARGFAGLNDCNQRKYIIWREAIMYIQELQTKYPDDILQEDAVEIFEKIIKEA